jgi:hypothetical protein
LRVISAAASFLIRYVNREAGRQRMVENGVSEAREVGQIAIMRALRAPLTVRPVLRQAIGGLTESPSGPTA